MPKTALRQGRIAGVAHGLKSLGGIGGNAPGTWEAIVAVFGNVDYQGDRIIAGAFSKSLANWATSGDPLPVIFSHQWDTLPAHIGTVLEAKELFPGDEALPAELRGNGGLWAKFRLDVDHPETYAPTIDRLMSERRLKEFSFAYDVFDERRGSDGANELLELDVLELGPTLKGANPATRLLSRRADAAKFVPHAFAPGDADADEDPTRCILCGLTRNTAAHNALARLADGKAAIASHSTATSDASWDGPANEANLSTDDGAEVYRQAYAWVDPDGDPDVKSSYKFIHHFVSDSGSVGAASTTASSTGIGILNGGRGGTTIPDADRQGVYNHLAKHLRDADMEPPELASASGEAAGDADGAKAWVTLDGALEQRQEAVYQAGSRWAADNEIGNGGFYAAYLEATFEDRVVLLVEGWADPCYEGTYWELDYTIETDGTATVSNPREVALQTTTVAKARAMKHRARPGSAMPEKTSDTVSGEPHPGKSKGKAEAREGKAEDPEARTGSGEDGAAGNPASALLELEELELS
jgi:HK97 family phage prohead protease